MTCVAIFAAVKATSRAEILPPRVVFLAGRFVGFLLAAGIGRVAILVHKKLGILPN